MVHFSIFIPSVWVKPELVGALRYRTLHIDVLISFLPLVNVSNHLINSSIMNSLQFIHENCVKHGQVIVDGVFDWVDVLSHIFKGEVLRVSGSSMLLRLALWSLLLFLTSHRCSRTRWWWNLWWGATLWQSWVLYGGWWNVNSPSFRSIWIWCLILVVILRFWVVDGRFSFFSFR